MTTLYIQGYVLPPTQSNDFAYQYGYDNGGWFGPQYSNLGGKEFLITVNGDLCNCYGGSYLGTLLPDVFTSVTITINDITVDLFNNSAHTGFNRWDDNAVFLYNSSPFMDWFTTQYLFAPTHSGFGRFELSGGDHHLGADGSLQIVQAGSEAFRPLPAPVAGSGLIGLLALGCLLWKRWRY